MESLACLASKWNFEDKALLLPAEEQFCEGNLNEAEQLYDAAIHSAKDHPFLNEQA